MKRFIILILISYFSIPLSGCAVNPVTGERELSLVGREQEVAIGQKQYHPSIQMQGGPYAVDPEINNYVRDVGRKLAEASDRQLPYEFAVINNSVPNAWALPGGKIALNRGLLIELENEAELAAVIGHEIVHAAARHGAKQLERGLLLQGGVMAAGLAVEGSDYAGLAVGGAQVAAQLISQKYSREAESEADYYGMRYMAEVGYDPQAAVSLQEKFVKLAGEGKTGWLQGLFASHPPSQQRVEDNKITVQSLPEGGIIARDRYQRKTTSIRKNASAYEAYNEGMTALKKGDLNKAAELAAKAINIEPGEGKFYGLQGDILAAGNDYEQAIQAYNKGINQPGEFFNLYLQRGMARKKLGLLAEAQTDFRKSLDLLPTDVAYNEMGQLALTDNRRQQAKEYFSQAASSQSRAGREAYASLVRLDLPDNPGNYIGLEADVNEKNRVRAIRITNATPLPVRSVVITAAYTGPDGRRYQKKFTYPSELVSGGTGRLEVNLPTRDLSLKVTSAGVKE